MKTCWVAGPLMGRYSYFQDHFLADLRAKDHEGLTERDLVGLHDDDDVMMIGFTIFFSNRKFLLVQKLLKISEPRKIPDGLSKNRARRRTSTMLSRRR